MRTLIRNLLAGSRSGVIPVLRPTVPTADTVSNNTSPIAKDGLVAAMANVPNATEPTPRSATASA
jgi:hypothetical protein